MINRWCCTKARTGRLLEAIPVKIKVAERDTLTPASSGDAKLGVVGAMCLVINGGLDSSFQSFR
jgi:hypothetical protein